MACEHLILLPYYTIVAATLTQNRVGVPMHLSFEKPICSLGPSFFLLFSDSCVCQWRCVTVCERKRERERSWSEARYEGRGVQEFAGFTGIQSSRQSSSFRGQNHQENLTPPTMSFSDSCGNASPPTPSPQPSIHLSNSLSPSIRIKRYLMCIPCNNTRIYI